VVLASILGSSLAGIDATVVGIALPRIGRDLSTGFAGLQWTITGYTVTLASLILLGGAAGDRFGRRRVFLTGTVWFTTASLLCAVAPSIQLLVTARILQGVGGALLTPASLAVLQASFRPQDRAAAVGTWAGFSGVAGALAPFVGGWLLSVASWRWVFVVNLPLAAVVVVVALRHMPESRDEDSVGRSLDWAGAATTVVALAGLTYALIGVNNASSTWTMAASTIAIASILALVHIERRSPAPLLAPPLLRYRQFTATNAVTLVVYGAIGVFFFLLVLQLQVVVGWSPLATGSATIPVTILTLCLSRLSARASQRLGPTIQMTLGPLLCAGAALGASHISPGARFLTDVLPAVLLFGLGLATFVAPLTSTALSSIPSQHAGVASGVNNAVARTGSLVAIAAVPALTGIANAGIADADAFSAGFRSSMSICAALFIIGGLIALTSIRRPSRHQSID
jgi:EmrB/QacA subfamily drug resistance transporter